MRRRNFCKTICGVAASLSTTGILSNISEDAFTDASEIDLPGVYVFNVTPEESNGNYISLETIEDIRNWGAL